MLVKLNQATTQNGFTLVEVLTVMLVLVAIASVTIEVSSDLAFQNRYEVTKDRYEKIKRAIIGRPDVLINGQPDISGFVADVGRLPFALQELLDGNHCSDTQYFNQTDCEAASKTWAVTPNWNGPYMSTTKAFDDVNALSDGWGNNGQGNYGWNVIYYSDAIGTTTTTISNAISMEIKSLGKDSALNGSNYNADYPNNQPAIRQNDWQIDINGFPLRILSSSISGTCTPSTPTDPATCTFVGGSWTDPSCTGENITTQNDCILLDGTWDSGTSSCTGYSISSSAACTHVSGSWLGPGICVGVITPLTKLACLSSGGSWANNSTSNLCLKIIDQTGSSKISSSSQTISEDGTSQVIHFPYSSSSYVTSGENIGILYTDASCIGSVTYYSSHAKNICIDTNDDANFTSTNCVSNGGVFIDDGAEKYCSNVIGGLCTGGTSPELGGTDHVSISVILTPHSILPTVTW